MMFCLYSITIALTSSIRWWFRYEMARFLRRRWLWFKHFGVNTHIPCRFCAQFVRICILDKEWLLVFHFSFVQWTIGTRVIQWHFIASQRPIHAHVSEIVCIAKQINQNYSAQNRARPHLHFCHRRKDKIELILSLNRYESYQVHSPLKFIEESTSKCSTVCEFIRKIEIIPIIASHRCSIGPSKNKEFSRNLCSKHRREMVTMVGSS